MEGAMVTIDRIDHVVFTVRDVQAACDFYSCVLGMRVVTFDEGRRTALHFGRHKINLHLAGKEFEPKAARPTPGSADVCFIADTPIDAVVAHLRACNVEIIEGPVRKAGATGTLSSVYFRDPDGNLIEVSNYTQNSRS